MTGDSKEVVREKAQLLILKLMERDVITPQALFEKLTPAFSHKNGKIREEVMNCLQTTLTEWVLLAVSVHTYVLQVGYGLVCINLRIFIRYVSTEKKVCSFNFVTKMNYVFVYTISTHRCQKYGMYLFMLYGNVRVIYLTDHLLVMYIHNFFFLNKVLVLMPGEQVELKMLLFFVYYKIYEKRF